MTKTIEDIKGPVLLFLFLLSITIVIAGYKYYRKTQEDPNFCMSCHLMKEAYKTWQRSKHKGIVCQECHRLTLIEQNRLLIAFVAGTKEIKESHGRIKPWNSCKKCHFSIVEQGAIIESKAFGHTKHVFIKKIGCNECHHGDLHEFRSDTNACLKCHQDRLVHGLGMESLQCLNCHTFTEAVTQNLVSEKRCMRCHKIEKGEIMSALKCFDCHKPHGNIKPESKDCLGRCHSQETKVGQHGLHIKKAGLQCLDCHRAHKWKVTKEFAGKICTRCHEYRNPVRFVF